MLLQKNNKQILVVIIYFQQALVLQLKYITSGSGIHTLGKLFIKCREARGEGQKWQ